MSALTDGQPPRHQGIASLLKFFDYDHLPEHLQATSKACHDLAHAMADELPSGPELTAGLRKLLEAKDCFVRAVLD
ncbi:hypothetical protein [Kibdelosporangium phytohabitans]|uniref:Uncharacterized protein n=1 Tax=Kibdelosporangium phytohabitans TaxID=860235 RepID=A0A0N9IIE4_9PSEU|nr:hypothetical protein [Kibdelosporangium phytohabitans]ALG14752.1 hypothetical protein AOZ06_12735 [Kibdelosporangium phytohabitans]ALG14757.1 hypothetical protein AOZ06_13055 [Kibdelosporangium phytohabitans]MBE1471384.1 hypothetical protein [Kibdelosporangium phytohabitans]